MKKRRKQVRKKPVEKKSTLWIAKNIPLRDFQKIARTALEKFPSRRGCAADNFKNREKWIARQLQAFYRKNLSQFKPSNNLCFSKSYDIRREEPELFGSQPPTLSEPGFRWEKETIFGDSMWIQVPVIDEVVKLPKPRASLVPYPTTEEYLQRLAAAQREVSLITEFLDPKNQF